MSHSTSSVSTTLIRAQYGARRALSIATRAIPSAVLWLAPIVGWATAALLLGAAVGLSAVTLPPTGAFAIPAIAALVLLWALPELPALPVRTVRALFPIVLVVDLCVPVYYAIAGTGLPWISVRRIATFPLILCISLVVAGSSEARARIVRRLGAAKLISTCAIGYGVMMALSVFTSSAPSASISAVIDAVLIWYVPFITIIYLTSDEGDVDRFIKTIAWCTVFISVCGLVDWVLERNIFIAILPKPILNALMESSPTFADMATTGGFRNGEFRAPSVFNNSLSFGQFEAMIVPFGYYFLLHRRGVDQWLGFLVVASGLLGVITSGARGAYVALIAATPVFAGLWALRKARFNPRSLEPAMVGVAGGSGFTGLIILIFTWVKLRNRVLGRPGDPSTQSRWDQWHMALPHIQANPLTGHGVGTGADVVGYFNPGAEFPTLDSMLISMLVETGVPGFLFFYGSVIFAIVLGARKYLLDSSSRGAFAGGLSCSLIAFLVYSIVLSQVENFTLLFLFLGLTIALLSLDGQSEKREQTPQSASKGSPPGLSAQGNRLNARPRAATPAVYDQRLP